MNCSACGAVDQHAAFCVHCGASLTQQPNPGQSTQSLPNPSANQPIGLIPAVNPWNTGPLASGQSGLGSPPFGGSSPGWPGANPGSSGWAPGGQGPGGGGPGGDNFGGRPPSGGQQAWAEAPSTGWAIPPVGPGPGWVNPPPLPPVNTEQKKRKTWILVGAVAVTVAVLAVAAVFVFKKSSSPDQAVPLPPTITTPSSKPTTAPLPFPPGTTPVTTTPVTTVTTTVTSTPPGPPTTPGTTPGTTPITTTPPTTPISTTPKPAPPVNPMGGRPVAFTCGTGFIVQIASEQTEAAYQARVAQLRATKTLPDNAVWTQTNSPGCRIFNTSTNFYVLYAGPFATWQDACATRLASPADSFIRPSAASDGNPVPFFSCLCTVSASAPPPIPSIGIANVWVGVLQQILQKDKYSISGLDGTGTNAWGIFTQDTSAAVNRFQTANNLTATGAVDAVTWASLQGSVC